MKILVLEDEQRNAMRLIRLLNGIDTTFTIEGPLASIKETVEFFQSGKAADLILADIRLTDGLSFEALKYAPATVPIIFTTAYDGQPSPSYSPPHTMNMRYRLSSSIVSTIS